MTALGFSTECTVYWKLDKLSEVVDDFEDKLAAATIQQKVKREATYLYAVLSAAGKSLVTIREIICLCAMGLPDGALSLSRNLYEQFIALNFLENQRSSPSFSDYIEDYFLDYDIQRTKVLKYAAQTCLGNEQKAKEIEAEISQLRTRAHRTVKHDWWWTGYSSFADVVKYLRNNIKAEREQRFLADLHLYYKRACCTLHSSCLGNQLRLGDDPEFRGIDTSAHTRGQEIPLYLSVVSLLSVFGIACKELKIDFEPFKIQLNELAIFYQEQDRREQPNA